MLGLTLTTDERKILDVLNASSIRSRRVIGRGLLTVDVAEVKRTEKFKAYQKQASEIVAKSN